MQHEIIRQLHLHNKLNTIKCIIERNDIKKQRIGRSDCAEHTRVIGIECLRNGARNHIVARNRAFNQSQCASGIKRELQSRMRMQALLGKRVARKQQREAQKRQQQHSTKCLQQHKAMKPQSAFHSPHNPCKHISELASCAHAWRANVVGRTHNRSQIPLLSASIANALASCPKPVGRMRNHCAAESYCRERDVESSRYAHLHVPSAAVRIPF